MRCTELQELASAHAVGASTAAEAARIEALAADDADLRAELASFRDAAAAVAIGQPATSSPSAAVRAAVLAKIARTPQARPGGTAGTGEGFLFRFRDEGEWQPTPVPGLRVKLLSISEDLGHRTILAELAPGACFPEHDHGGSEDLMVLSGDLVTEGRTLRAGDFLHAGPGTHHATLVSPNGCVALIIEPIPAKAPARNDTVPA